MVEFTIYGFSYRFTRLHSSSRTPTAFWICLLISMLYWLLSRSIQGSWKPSSVLNEQVFLPLILSIGNIVFHFYSSYSPKKMPAPSRQIKGMIRPFFFFFFQPVTASSSRGCRNYATEASQKKRRPSCGCR